MIILFQKLTQQTKKAVGEATKSVQEVSKTAIEKSKTAAGASKNTLDDLTYISKSTLGDITKSAKEVAAKKGLLKVRVIYNYGNVEIFMFSSTIRDSGILKDRHPIPHRLRECHRVKIRRVLNWSHPIHVPDAEKLDVIFLATSVTI